MRMYSSRIICHALILIFLLLVNSGCVKRMVAAKDDNLAGATSASVNSIKVSDDALRIEIATDKPLIYTSYKMNEPHKIVVDLAQTEPGAITSPIVVNSGNISKIELSRQNFSSGTLTRIEISLVNDAEFSTEIDPVDKGRLLISFVKPKTEEKPSASVVEPLVPEVKVEAKTVVTDGNPEEQAKIDAKAEQKVVESEAKANVKDVVDGTKDLQKPEVKTEAVAEGTGTSLAIKHEENHSPSVVNLEEKPVLPQAKQEITENVVDSKPVVSAKTESAPLLKALSAIRILDDGVELVVSGGVDTFNPFRLNQPERLVLDIFAVRSAMTSNVIAINNFGVGNARIGLTPEKVRVVFDAIKDKLPSYEVVKSESGLKIRFTEATVPPLDVKHKDFSVVKTEPVVPVLTKKDSPMPGRHGIGVVEAIDFKVVDGFSRIAITLTGDYKPEKPVKNAKGFSLAIHNCQIPRNLQRSINTRAFTSPVVAITPYQGKSKVGFTTTILVKLRGNAPFTFKQEGNTLLWDIKNPVLPVSPALVSGAAKQKSAPVLSHPEDELVAPVAKEEAAVEIPKMEMTPLQSKKVYKGRKVTLEFSDADIRKIFQLIAEVSNLNFLIADDVTGTISIKLVNVPWDQALDVILDSKNLGMQREGNIVQIRPKAKMQNLADEELNAKKARERAMELRTEIFDINYAEVGIISSQFSNLKSDRGTISSDTRTNRVIVKDISTAIEEMKSLLKNLDTPEKQVMIEARIVEASTNFTRDLGVQWGTHYKDGTASILNVSRLDTGFGGLVSAPPVSGTSGPGAALGLSFGKLASNIQLDLRLSAAATIGQVKIISTPKVVTLNNKAAKISQGQSIPYQTTSAEGTKTEFVEAALTLEVTPHITADGSIGMKIKASNNSPGSGTPPPINKKEATTEMLVKNNETTVIGGIYVDSDTESDTGVPFLQDIPLLGWLFKSNTKTKTKTELLIFITPKIVE